MDRNVVTATILIALIMVVWLTWLAPPIQPPPPPGGTDSTAVVVEPEEFEETPEPIGQEGLRSVDELASDSTIAGASVGTERTIRISNDLYTAVLSTKGGTIVSFELSEFRDAVDSTLVQLVDPEQDGALGMVFTTPSNRVYDTRSFYFDADVSRDEITVGDAAVTVTMKTAIGSGSISKIYTFKPDSYDVGFDLAMEGTNSFLTPAGYELIWYGAIPFTEKDRDNEIRSTGAFAKSGGEVEFAKVLDESYDENSLRGDVDWVAVKGKYFAAVMLPNQAGRGAELIAERVGELSDPDVRLAYIASLAMPPPVESDGFRLYLGPMELSRIRQYDADLYDMVDFGWSFFATITRPLAKYFFAPVFYFLATFIPNYGLVIIIFSILVKLLVYPLTKSSFTSMAKMRQLQPRMEAIKAKYPDSPPKQQEAMMKMYKETGVNPIGGCLPMLLQYPIIIALWQFLPQAIEIRQQGFLWAHDLSAPDVILSLPFTIPLYGDFVSGFTVLMGLSMVVQMRLQATPSSNAQAKMFMYVFPVMIFVIFNRLAAGLNLYYLCYNVLSAAQQKWINRNLEAHPEEMAPAKTAKKGSGGKKRGRSSGRKKR
ncbi:MAG: membrane protein insertase YidC [Rhodothermales bacterium]|nr:membrane protein insertase YidC [Rhodothermales bacterium]